MKSIQFITALPAFMLFLYACQKDDNVSDGSPKMVADKTQVTPGETVSFSVTNGTAGALARWSVTPSTNVIISRAMSWDQRNTITFNAAGNYTVNVELKKVWCDSAAAANPGMDTCLNGGVKAGNAHATIVVKN